MLKSIAEIEDYMAQVMLSPDYPKILAEYERRLAIMGNVDGNEVVALVLSCIPIEGVTL